VIALAQQAAQVIQSTLGSVGVMYAELQDGLWQARMLAARVPDALITDCP